MNAKKKDTKVKQSTQPKHGFDKPANGGMVYIDAIGGDQNLMEPHIPENKKQLVKEDPYTTPKKTTPKPPPSDE